MFQVRIAAICCSLLVPHSRWRLLGGPGGDTLAAVVEAKGSIGRPAPAPMRAWRVENSGVQTRSRGWGRHGTARNRGCDPGLTRLLSKKRDILSVRSMGFPAISLCKGPAQGTSRKREKSHSGPVRALPLLPLFALRAQADSMKRSAVERCCLPRPSDVRLAGHPCTDPRV